MLRDLRDQGYYLDSRRGLVAPVPAPDGDGWAVLVARGAEQTVQPDHHATLPEARRAVVKLLGLPDPGEEPAVPPGPADAAIADAERAVAVYAFEGAPGYLGERQSLDDRVAVLQSLRRGAALASGKRKADAWTREHERDQRRRKLARKAADSAWKADQRRWVAAHRRMVADQKRADVAASRENYFPTLTWNDQFWAAIALLHPKIRWTNEARDQVWQAAVRLWRAHKLVPNVAAQMVATKCEIPTDPPQAAPIATEGRRVLLSRPQVPPMTGPRRVDLRPPHRADLPDRLPGMYWQLGEHWMTWITAEARYFHEGVRLTLRNDADHGVPHEEWTRRSAEIDYLHPEDEREAGAVADVLRQVAPGVAIEMVRRPSGAVRAEPAQLAPAVPPRAAEPSETPASPAPAPAEEEATPASPAPAPAEEEVKGLDNPFDVPLWQAAKMRELIGLHYKGVHEGMIWGVRSFKMSDGFRTGERMWQALVDRPTDQEAIREWPLRYAEVTGPRASRDEVLEVYDRHISRLEVETFRKRKGSAWDDLERLVRDRRFVAWMAWDGEPERRADPHALAFEVLRTLHTRLQTELRNYAHRHNAAGESTDALAKLVTTTDQEHLQEVLTRYQHPASRHKKVLRAVAEYLDDLAALERGEPGAVAAAPAASAPRPAAPRPSQPSVSRPHAAEGAVVSALAAGYREPAEIQADLDRMDPAKARALVLEAYEHLAHLLDDVAAHPEKEAELAEERARLVAITSWGDAHPLPRAQRTAGPEPLAAAPKGRAPKAKKPGVDEAKAKVADLIKQGFASMFAELQGKAPPR